MQWNMRWSLKICLPMDLKRCAWRMTWSKPQLWVQRYLLNETWGIVNAPTRAISSSLHGFIIHRFYLCIANVDFSFSLFKVKKVIHSKFQRIPMHTSKSKGFHPSHLSYLLLAGYLSPDPFLCFKCVKPLKVIFPSVESCQVFSVHSTRSLTSSRAARVYLYLPDTLLDI